MEFLSNIWFDFLYQPVFNALIWIYLHVAGENLGWAVVWLTIFLRVILLPLTIISERNALLQQKAGDDVAKAMQAHKNDRLAQKEAARKVMRSYHISPWAKVSALAIQALFLVLLYQVFLRGITGEKIIKILYSFIDFPGRINTVFYGFEIGRVHDYLWAGMAAAYLLVSIFLENRGKKVWNRADLYFVVLFPLCTFAVLWYLPMVKSLFILTTMLFSDIIRLIRHLLFSKKSVAHVAEKSGHH